MKLDKSKAKKIVETLTEDQLNLMFENAKNNITNSKRAGGVTSNNSK